MTKDKVSNDVLVERIEHLKDGLHGKLDDLIKQAKETNGKVKENTVARIQLQTTVKILQWAGGALAASDVVGLLVKLLVT